MICNTKFFGDIEYQEKDILSFPDGLYGFENYRSFLLINFEPENGSLLCLQSLQEEALAFVLMNPFQLLPDYSPELSQEDMKALNLSENSCVSYYAVCVVRDTAADSTVNLKCPIVINEDTHRGRQTMLENRQYTIRHLLKEFDAEREEVSDC